MPSFPRPKYTCGRLLKILLRATSDHWNWGGWHSFAHKQRLEWQKPPPSNAKESSVFKDPQTWSDHDFISKMARLLNLTTPGARLFFLQFKQSTYNMNIKSYAMIKRTTYAEEKKARIFLKLSCIPANSALLYRFPSMITNKCSPCNNARKFVPSHPCTAQKYFLADLITGNFGIGCSFLQLPQLLFHLLFTAIF